MRLKVAILLIIGLMQMSSDIFNLPLLKGIGAGCGASPAPKVFSAVNGYETFSVKYLIEWDGFDGKTHRQPLTAAVYSKMKGPYNRRNVYGAVLAYGPVLAANPHTSEMFYSVLAYAFGKESPLITELGLDPSHIKGKIKIVLQPLPNIDTHNLQLTFEGPRWDHE